MGIGRDISGDGKIGPTSPRSNAGRCIYCTLLFHMVAPHWSRVTRVQEGAPALQQNGWAAGPVWAREACG